VSAKVVQSSVEGKAVQTSSKVRPRACDTPKDMPKGGLAQSKSIPSSTIKTYVFFSQYAEILDELPVLDILLLLC